MTQSITLNPNALTRLIRDLYADNVELNLAFGPATQTKLDAFNAEFLGGSLTREQLVKIGRGEARLVARMGAEDTASWLAYVDDSVSNIRAAILCYVATNSGCYWGEIADKLCLGSRDRVVLYDLEREKLVETKTQTARYYITVAGNVAIAEGRS
jgi:hypothetical protein